MSYALTISPTAGKNIRDQRLWYESEIDDGEPLANRWTRELDEALEELRQHPERHGLAAENGKWHPEIQIRRMLFRPWKGKPGWRVLFAIDATLKVVSVLQVRHESRPLIHEEEQS